MYVALKVSTNGRAHASTRLHTTGIAPAGARVGTLSMHMHVIMKHMPSCGGCESHISVVVADNFVTVGMLVYGCVAVGQ